MEVIDKIRVVHHPMVGMPNNIIWGVDSSGLFSVKSCYKEFMGEKLGMVDRKWDVIWRWKGPERVKFFLWIVGHDRLCTNSRRAKWCACDPSCSVCQNQPETTTHVLRDCTEAKKVWDRV